jgi:hypothetical protein
VLIVLLLDHHQVLGGVSCHQAIVLIPTSSLLQTVNWGVFFSEETLRNRGFGDSI